MTVSLSPMARLQFTISGAPLSGGLLFTYAAGTNTKLATFTDATGATPNTNPVVLDSQGFCDLWLTDGQAYKLVLSPSTDTDPPTNAYWSRDNVSNNIIPFKPIFGTVNGITITVPATGATLTLANNSVLATSGAHSITLTSTADSNVTLPTAGTLARNDQATDTFGALTDITTNNVTTSQHGFAPKLSGNSMTFLNGIGTWTAAPTQSVIRSARTSNTILAGADNGSLVDITSGTFTQTFTAAATLGSGWYVWIRNSGTGDITLDPNAAELIDGLTSYIMYPGEARLVQCDGAAFTSVVVSQFYRTFTTSGTFTRPPGYAEFGAVVSSGGGSGERTNSLITISHAGNGGGAILLTIPSSLMGASQTITIGAGGAAVTTVAGGNNGGNSSIGTIVTVLGATFGGGSGNGGALSGFTGISTAIQTGIGSPSGNAVGESAVWGGGTGSSDASTVSGNSVYGGGAGGSVDASGNIRAPGTSVTAGNGGAAHTNTSGTDGTAPCGGGGATQTGTQSGAGARGQVDIWGIA